MRRREFIALFGASVTWPLAALAQEAGRTYGLGVLLPAARDVPVNAAFLDEFRRHGFFEGKNLSVEWRAYGPHPDLISQYAAELVEARVDVIAAGGVVGVRAAQRATTTIPIVAIVEDILGFGLVTSLARPPGNTTGVSGFVPELDGKRVEILIEQCRGFDEWQPLPMPTTRRLRSSTHYVRGRAHTTSSFQSIRSLEAKR
jgi:putative tryptophan/tyrosine transport system substrate-binding protein